MKKKLLIVGQMPPPVHGSNLMTELFYNSLKKLGHEVIIVQKTFSKRQKDVGKFSILKLIRFPFITVNLIYHLVVNKPDLCFYFLSVRPPSFFVDAFFLMLIRIFRVKYVLDLHGKGLLHLGTKSGRAIKIIFRKTIPPALGAFVLGERLKLDVNKFIHQNRLFVLPNAIVDLDPELSEFKENYNKDVTILFLSNLKPSKGPMEFLKMAKMVVDIRQNVKFILAGPQRFNQFHKKIENYIIQEGLKNFVEMPGAIYGSAKERLFIESDIFVFPTYYELEAFPLVNLEAMRAGLPIISSNEGSIPEMVIDGLNGYIINPKNIVQLADYVLRLIENSELRKKMGKAGRKFYETSFTINAYEKKLAQGLNFFFELKDAS